MESFRDLVAYYRGLLGLRQKFPRLGAWDAATPSAIEFLQVPEPMVAWTLDADAGDDAAWPTIAVFYNPLQRDCRVTLPTGKWRVLCDGTDASLWRGAAMYVGGDTVVKPVSVTVFGLVDKNYPETE